MTKFYCSRNLSSSESPQITETEIKCLKHYLGKDTPMRENQSQIFLQINKIFQLPTMASNCLPRNKHNVFLNTQVLIKYRILDPLFILQLATTEHPLK